MSPLIGVHRRGPNDGVSIASGGALHNDFSQAVPATPFFWCRDVGCGIILREHRRPTVVRRTAAGPTPRKDPSMMNSTWLALVLATLGAIAAGAAQAADVPDKQVPLPPSQLQLSGWLGQRVEANWKNRLLDHQPRRAAAALQESRPRAGGWSGEHIGKWLHAASLAWLYSHDEPLLQKRHGRGHRNAASPARGPTATWAPTPATSAGAAGTCGPTSTTSSDCSSYYDTFTGDPRALAAAQADRRPAGRHLRRRARPRDIIAAGDARGHGRHQRAGADRAALPRHARPALSRLRPLHRPGLRPAATGRRSSPASPHTARSTTPPTARPTR